jgi:hypothetical protein
MFRLKIGEKSHEGWGGNMTFLGRTPKVQIFAYGKKVSYLMHFHLAGK